MYKVEQVKIVKLISGEELVTLLSDAPARAGMITLSHPTQSVLSADEQLVLVPFILAGKTESVKFDENHIMTIVEPQDAIAEAYINILNGEHKTDTSEVVVPESKKIIL